MPELYELTAHELAGLVRDGETSWAEVAEFTPQIDQILGHFLQLQALDTEGVPPTSHAIAMTNVWREDVSRPSLPTAEVVANAPDANDGLFLVPRIVGEAPDA